MINTVKHLCYTLRISEQEIIQIISDLDQHYRPFRQPKRKYGGLQSEGGTIRMRDICPSIGKLKLVQERINRILQQCYIPGYAFGCVKGKDNIANAKIHLKNRYFLFVDLKDFFPNINNHQVFQMFRNNGFSPTVSRILTKLTTYKNSLPQGAASSPVIANLVFVSAGLNIQEIATANNLTFTTFMDDLILSSKIDFKFLANDILSAVKTRGFKPHHRKISYKKHRPEVTGILIEDGKATLPDSMIERAKTNTWTRKYLERVEKIND